MKKKFVLIAVSNCVLLACLGLVYAWSVFKKPLAASFGWSDGQMTWTFTICMSSFCLGGFFAAKITKRVKHNLVVIAAGFIICCGFLFASQMDQLWQLYVTYGVMIGFSVGVVYNCVLSTGNVWYTEKPGIMSGLFLMCFGAGSLIFGPISTAMMKSMGWSKTFIALGLIFLAVFIITSFQVVMPPKVEGKEIPVKYNDDGLDLGIRKVLKRSSFWIYLAWSTSLSAVGLGFVGQVFTISNSFGLTDMASSYMISIVAVGNGFGRLCFGSLYDVKERKITMNLISLITIAGTTILAFAVCLRMIPLIYLSFIFLGLGYGGITPTNSNYVRRFYGTGNYAVNFSSVNFNLLVSVFIGQYIGSTLYMNSGSYFYTAIAMIILSTVGFICSLFIKKP